MTNVKTPWGKLILQALYLASAVFYVFAAGRFRAVFDGMDIELPVLTDFIMSPPGLYLYPALVVGLFVLFLWSWKRGRLENKFILTLCNLPVLAGPIFFANMMFGPITSAVAGLDSASPLPTQAAPSASAPTGPTSFGQTTASFGESMPGMSVSKPVGVTSSAGRPAPSAAQDVARRNIVEGGFSTSISGYEVPSPAPSETARYAEYRDNSAVRVKDEPLSTFGLDVSTAGYANVRRFLNAGRFPEAGAVRVEEMLNYFPALPGETKLDPVEGAPFRAAYQLAPCPWDAGKTLLWVSVMAAEVNYDEAPPANLVFLVDVSGSMNPPERLPLVKASLQLLIDRLRPEDRVSLVTYANGSQAALKPTPGSEKSTIRSAVDRLSAAGGTAGSAGLQLAYDQAQESFIDGGVNRIILCTDGDFNIGVSGEDDLKAMLTRKRGRNVTLSVLGYGTNNLNDSMMAKIASAGNGNYGYVDTLSEAQKILGEEMESTLIVVAKDAKVQIEFNPSAVVEYRQIGYEKRRLNAEDFNDDRVDAGDVGAGKRVTVLYELVLAGGKSGVDPLRYEEKPESGPDALKPESGDAGREGAPNDAELAWLKLRWKAPEGKESSLAEFPILKTAIVPAFDEADSSLRFSAAVAAFGQKLRGNARLVDTEWKDVAAWAENARGSDRGGYRSELVRLIRLA
ncbi:MAG: VWA domain-containing protein, partial [Synergistaceae bacterium]|nr:VWA domain-containing protein [Synergistaceae bacterium]